MSMNYFVKNDKYALQAEPQYPLGPSVRLYRLVAMRNIGADVKEGDLGGLVAGPMNLSAEGECWIYDDSIAYSGAQVLGDAVLKDGAQISGSVTLEGRSRVIGTLKLLGYFTLSDDAYLEADDAMVVNMEVHRMGQYVLRGQTFFVPEFLLSTGSVSSFTLPAEGCTQRLASHLACRQAGDRLTFLRQRNGMLELMLPNPDGIISFDSIQQQLRTPTY
jgi:hypothetical protein